MTLVPKSNLLEDLTTVDAYQASRANVFPSLASLKWFIRQYSPMAWRNGALVKLAGRRLIHPTKFDELVLETGKHALNPIFRDLLPQKEATDRGPRRTR